MEPPQFKTFYNKPNPHPTPPPPCVTKMFELLFVEKGNYSGKKKNKRAKGLSDEIQCKFQFAF